MSECGLPIFYNRSSLYGAFLVSENNREPWIHQDFKAVRMATLRTTLETTPIAHFDKPSGNQPPTLETPFSSFHELF
jgi:hypothetical protein